jgi:hypothetical protein
VISKSSGKYKEIKSFGIAGSVEDAENLCDDAHKWIGSYSGQQEFDFDDSKGREPEETERVINMDAVLINGTQLLPDRIYENIGFNQISDEILRHLVIARVSQPAGKPATTEYLKSYYDEDIDLNHIWGV